MFSKDTFIDVLNTYPDTRKYWLAYSGGIDSTVLLHLFHSIKSEIKTPVEAVFVNHGLNNSSPDWATFCDQQCTQYGFEFSQINIDETCPKGRSIEEWARERRYQLIAEKMDDKDILFTAHHLDDQAETFFLQALRGAGPRGLVSMPSIKKKQKGFHARPLLFVSQKQIRNYAVENNLSWIEDDSNTDVRFDRNYLRHNILPAIEARWPAYRETIARLIKHQKEYKSVLDELAQEDMCRARFADISNLNIDILQELSIERQKNLIFYWLDALQLAPPGFKHIENILSELINLDTDKAPCVNWSNTEVRRYKNVLYAGRQLEEHDIETEYAWRIEEEITILNETLKASSAHGKGIAKDKLTDASLVIRHRQGGEKIQPANMQHSKTIKQLFQEKSVLPWYRDRIPLLYVNGELAAIPGFCVDKKYAAKENDAAFELNWSGYEKAVQL